MTAQEKVWLESRIDNLNTALQRLKEACLREGHDPIPSRHSHGATCEICRALASIQAILGPQE